MKKIILLLLFTSSFYAQCFNESSHSYYVLNKDKTEWNDSITLETSFEICTKTICYTNNNSKKIFNIITSDENVSNDNGDTVFRVNCKDSKDNEVEVIFMTSKEKRKYIYVLSDDSSLSFEID